MSRQLLFACFFFEFILMRIISKENRKCSRRMQFVEDTEKRRVIEIHLIFNFQEMDSQCVRSTSENTTKFKLDELKKITNNFCRVSFSGIFVIFWNSFLYSFVICVKKIIVICLCKKRNIKIEIQKKTILERTLNRHVFFLWKIEIDLKMRQSRSSKNLRRSNEFFSFPMK